MAFTNSPAKSFEPGSNVVLENRVVRVVIAPYAGGRILEYRLLHGPNVLQGDPEMEPGEVPEPSFDARFQPLQGHVFWVSPQSRWWSSRGGEERGKEWPPDPWLIYGRDKIVARTAHSLQLQGVPSPLSGVRLDKQYELLADGRLQLEAVMTNVSDEPATWAIWSNTRLPITSRLRLPKRPEVSWRYSHEPGLQSEYQSWRLEEKKDWLAVDLAETGEAVTGKALVTTEIGWVEARHSGLTFQKSTAWLAGAGEVPVGHGPVEIFATAGPSGGEGFLEIEFHGAERTLAPGESQKYRETWRLVEE